MANNGYDEPGTKGKGTSSGGSSSSSTPSKFNSNSTAGGGSSFTHGDNLDPANRGENGLWRPHGDSTGSPEGGASDKAGKAAGGGVSDNTGTTSGGASDNTGTPSEDSGGEDSSFTKSAKKGKSNSTSRFKSTFKMTPKQAAIGGGVITGFAGLGAAGFLLLIPLKVEHIISNLQSRFYATSENAMKNESQNLMEKYVKNHVLNDYKKCGTTISKKCSVNIISAGSNPVSNLYKSWSQAKFENKLATNFGIEYKYDGTNWYLKAPGTPTGGDNIGPNGEGLNSEFKRADRSTMRLALKQAMEGETYWKQAMYRYQDGRLREEKYGIKRCIIFCGTKDALADKTAAKKTAAQIYIVQRVITPRTQTLGIVMECMLDPNCTPEKTQPTTPQDGSTGELSATPEDPTTEANVRTNLESLASNYGVTDSASVDKMIQDYKDLEDKGYQKVVLQEVLDKALTKIGLGEISQQVADTAPLIGWANAGAKAITALNTAGPKIKKLGYITNAAAAVSLFSMYQTYASEIHTGHVDPTEVGSLANSLGGGNSGSATDPEVGGTASAENAPLYKNLMDKGPYASGSTSLIDNLLPSKAYAATTSSTSSTASNYTCYKNKPLKGLVCPEEKLGGGNDVLNSIHDVLNTPPLSFITAIAGAWSGIVGKLLGFIGNLFGSVLSSIPLVGSLIKDASSFVTKLIQPFLAFLINEAIPNPFGSNMSGGRKFDMMAAGADVGGNDFAHTGLGGKKVSDAVAANIFNQQEAEAKAEFNQQPFFARMFSMDSKYSLVSQVAMDMPLSTHGTVQDAFGSLLNPLNALSHGFSSIFSSGRASAASTTQKDAFGVAQYAPEAVDDPEAYWTAHCSDNAAQAYQNDADFNNPATSWVNLAASKNDDNTGMPENDTTNPCLTIKRATCAVGATIDTTNCTGDDMADQNGSSSSSASSSPSTTSASGSAQDLAKQILANSKITLSGRLVKSDLQAAAAGKPASAGAAISSALLKLIATIGQSHSVDISAIESGGSGHASGSYHYSGDAVDFDSVDGTALTGRNAPAIVIMKIAEGVLPSGSAFGQQGCGATPTLPSGFTEFADTCNHLHVQVPRGTP